jgi:hypothetical protein
MADQYSGHKLGLLIRHMGSQRTISSSLFPAIPIKPSPALNCKVFQVAFVLRESNPGTLHQIAMVHRRIARFGRSRMTAMLPCFWR